MNSDLFSFWADVKAETLIHAADIDVFARSKHNFNLNCLPRPYWGPLKTAPIVLLYLSPRHRNTDSLNVNTETMLNYCRNQRTGVSPLPDLKEKPTHYKWWSEKVKQFGIEPKIAIDKVAFLNLTGYHSDANFKDYHMLAALPSSRVTLNWVQESLFKDAEDKKRIVICLRSAKYWGLEDGYCKGTLYAPKYTRRGIMHKNQNIKNEIIESVRNILHFNQKEAA